MRYNISERKLITASFLGFHQDQIRAADQIDYQWVDIMKLLRHLILLIFLMLPIIAFPDSLRNFPLAEGRWVVDNNLCSSIEGIDGGWFEFDGNSISSHETTCIVTKSTSISEKIWKVDTQCDSEGEQLASSEIYRFEDNQRLSCINDYRIENYVLCNGGQQPSNYSNVTKTIKNSCSPKNYTEFLGGYIIGAAGTILFSPVDAFEEFLEMSDDAKEEVISANPLTIRIHGNPYEAGCEGFAELDPDKVWITEPLGGGLVRGGKFTVVRKVISYATGKKSAVCEILVRTEDLSCATGAYQE